MRAVGIGLLSLGVMTALAWGCGKSVVPGQGRPSDGGAAGHESAAGAAEPGPEGGATTEPVGGTGGTTVAGAAGAPSEPTRPVFQNYQVTGSWPERPVALEQRPGALTYRKVAVHTRFLADSCAIGDYDGDGEPDVSSGRRWYSGPDFTLEHLFRDGHDDLPREGLTTELVTGISDDHADYAVDVDGDGDADIINIAYTEGDENHTPNPAPIPQKRATAYWYENPGEEAKLPERKWEGHLMHADVRHEQHGIFDINGDGVPEIFGACKACPPGQTLGYFQADPRGPELLWAFHAMTGQVEFPFNGTSLIHGLGVGRVNADAAPDLLEPRGVWLGNSLKLPGAPPCAADGCTFLEVPFAPRTTDGRGGAQMYVNAASHLSHPLIERPDPLDLVGRRTG